MGRKHDEDRQKNSAYISATPCKGRASHVTSSNYRIAWVGCTKQAAFPASELACMEANGMETQAKYRSAAGDAAARWEEQSERFTGAYVHIAKCAYTATFSSLIQDLQKRKRAWVFTQALYFSCARWKLKPTSFHVGKSGSFPD